MQLAQLLLVHRAGRLAHQILRTLGLRKGDHVADRFGAGHHGDNAVEAECQPAMWRRAELERVEQEAEFLFRVFRSNVKRAEHLGLDLLAMDTHRPAADFPAV